MSSSESDMDEHPPIVRLAPPPEPPAIYTFLGLATLPRLRKGNPLRILPREMVLKIARLAHTPKFHASFVVDGEDAAAVDVRHFGNDDGYFSGGLVLRTRPIRTGVHYVEVRVGHSDYGTRVFFDGVRPVGYFAPPVDWREGFGVELASNESDSLKTLLFLNDETENLIGHHIAALTSDSWVYDAEVTFGVLVDMRRGCVTFRLNGVDGPCVRFPGDLWRSGVRIAVDGFYHYEYVDHGRCIVSCATRPAPPSILEAASNPRTVGELLESGSLIRDPFEV